MHLISTLSAGVAAAPLGKAEVYVRGTSTRATLYADFEASTSDSSGSDIQLDSYGSAIRYVNQLVDVRVKNADGSLVRSFVEGDSAPNTEVRSQSFTGADYVTLQQGANKPTQLQAVLDSWLTSAGAKDWKVLIDGAEVTLQNFAGQTLGMFYNPRSPEFGAVGDFTVNDTAAFQAAHDAAVSNGGGIVLVPPGSYLLGQLIWSTVVHLAAVPGTVRLGSNAAAGPVLSIEDAIGSDQELLIYGISFENSGAATDDIVGIDFNGSHPIRIANCRFIGNNSAGGIVTTTAVGAPLTIDSCSFEINHDSGRALETDYNTDSSAQVSVNNCRIVMNNAGAEQALVEVGNAVLVATNNVFDMTAASIAIALGAGRGLRASGNRFLGNAGSDFAVIVRPGRLYYVDESNEFLNLAGRYYRNSDDDISAEGSYLAIAPYLQVTSSATTVNIASNYRSIVISSGAADTPAVNFPAPLQPGQLMTLVLHNNTAGAWSSDTDFTCDDGGNPRPLGYSDGGLLGGDTVSTSNWCAVETQATGLYQWTLIGLPYNGV